MLKLRWGGRAPRRSPEDLPPHLEHRLRAIARRELLCRDFDRLWPEVLVAGGALEAALREQIDRHVDGCRRCAAVSEILAEAIPQPHELPAGLEARLQAIPHKHQRPLPFYLGDVRFAAAASWILAFALTLLLGGPRATAERTAALFERPAEAAGRELGELSRVGQDLLVRLEGRTRGYSESLSGEWRRLGEGLSELPDPLGRSRPAPDEVETSTNPPPHIPQ